MTRRLSYIYLLLFAVLVSCDEIDSSQETGPSFKLETKAVGEVAAGTTYRVAAYNATPGSNQFYHYSSSGTYRIKDGEELLSSCELDDAGTTVISESSSSALNGMSGDYFLVLASPGKSINSDGSFNFSPDDDSDMLRLNKPMSSTLGNYGTIEFTEPLYIPRTNLVFKIYKNVSGTVEDIEVTDAYVTSVNAADETVKLYPATRQVQVGDPSAHRALILNAADKSIDETGNKLFYATDAICVASGYYAPKSVLAERLHLNTSAQSCLVESSYIYFGCNLKQGAREKVPIRIPLNANSPELLPQMDYVYRVTISSNYISLDLDIYDAVSNAWQEGGTFTENVSTPSGSYQIGTWTFDDWGVTDDLGQTIG